MRARSPGRPVLRDTATMCLAVFSLPASSPLCELDKGHLDQGIKHKSGCTHWGAPALSVPKED